MFLDAHMALPACWLEGLVEALLRWGCEFIDLILKVYTDFNYNKARTAFSHFPKPGFLAPSERLATAPKF